jgi:hypothetical protein
MKIPIWIALFAASYSIATGAEKQLKPGESEIYTEVVKDLGAPNFPKALSDLDTWRQKFPDSDFTDERSALYVQTYAGSNQPAKALDTAGDLLSKDLTATFPGPTGQPTIIRLLYNAVWAISQIASPTPGELTSGATAAHQLMAYDQPLPGVTAEKWNEARTDMRDRAAAALLYIAMLPGIQAMAKQPPDCPAAESAYSKALMVYPDRAALSYELGRALNCEAKTMPDKQAPAVYEFLRAAVIDPTLGNPGNDKKKIQTFADNAYIRLHGGAEGLEQLKLQVKESPLPPADFTIRTATEIAESRRLKFEKDNPQLALWMKIKGALSDSNGEQYFAGELKDSAVPPLKGTLMEATPECRPKELLVAVPLPPLPDAQQQSAPIEIRLKLDKPLTGKPEVKTEFQWEGVPSAFTREPFLLTMDVETARLQDLKTTPCASPVKSRVRKK